MIEQFEIQSDITLMPDVEERLFHFCQLCNVGRYYSAVCVATTQAVENAIVHGNKQDAGKTVQIEAGTCRGGIYIEVADQGAGFNHQQYGSLPTADVEQGNGIFVMQTLADKLTYLDGGRRVRLEFMVAGIDPSEALYRATLLQERFAMVAA